MPSLCSLPDELLLTIYTHNLPTSQEHEGDLELGAYLHSTSTSHRHRTLAQDALAQNYTQVITLNLTGSRDPIPGLRARVAPFLDLDTYGGTFVSYAQKAEIEVHFDDWDLRKRPWSPATSHVHFDGQRDRIRTATEKICDLVAVAPRLRELHVRVREELREDWERIEQGTKAAVLEQYQRDQQRGEGEMERGLVVETGEAARRGPEERFAALLGE